MKSIHRAMLAAILLVGLTAAAAGAVEAAAQAEPMPEPAVRPEEAIGEPAGPPLSGAVLERSTEELSSIIRCPVCQALSVEDSPSTSAIAMKQEVRALLARGYSEDQVLSYFEQAYGEFIRLEPRARGFNLVVWLAPAVALLLGAALVMRRVRGRPSPVIAGSGGAAAAAAAEEELAPYLERVRREVGE